MGHTKNDYTNQIFGNLKAIKPTEIRRCELIVWELECIKCYTKILRVPSWLNKDSKCGDPRCGLTKRTKDFTNKIYGTLKAIRPTEKLHDRSVIWEFQCIKCHNLLFRVPNQLGPTSYCGNSICSIGLIYKDLTGRIFGKLTVSKLHGQNKNTQFVWDCLCECGNVTKVITTRLIRGTTKSCGCNRSLVHSKEPGKVSWNTRWSRHLDSSCKDRNIENKIDQEEFICICSENCFYCDAVPRPYNAYANENGQIHKRNSAHGISQETVDRAWIDINGIDRVDNNKGYTLDNCVPCCWECNQMKSSLNLYEWLAFIEKFQPSFTIKILQKLEKSGIKIPLKESA